MFLNGLLRVSKGILIIASFGFYISCGFSDDISHKTDAVMIRNFQQNKKVFENLINMIKTDEQKIGKQMFRIDDDWTAPKNLEEFGVNRERVEEYRRIFGQLGIPRGFYAYGNGEFYMLMSTAQGLGVSGSSKSYVWSADAAFPNFIETDIDSYRQNHSKSTDYPVYRRIEGNWFLCYESD